jgi:hypothetical protein
VKKDDIGGGGSAADWNAAGWDEGDNLRTNKRSGGNNNNDLYDAGKPAYQGFGLLGKVKQPTAVFGTKKMSGDEGADLLDNILDDFEEKKGIESTKPKSIGSSGGQSNPPRLTTAKSANVPLGQGTDAWGRETYDDLDDLHDDNKSKKSGSASHAAQQSIQDKKKALFGLSTGGSNHPEE